MKIPLVDLNAQYADLKDEVNAAIERVLANSSFILGAEVTAFEQAFAPYVGASQAVGVASGTAALHLALLACGVGPNDEVITTAHTFIATAEAISHTGARPVFVDIDPRTYTLDPEQVEDAITPRTRAIVPVHLYGHPAAMDDLLDIASRRNLWLVEDAAQAHGATYNGVPCGSLGHLACFSFYPGKNLGAYGDAGAVTGNDRWLLDRVRKLRDHGRTSKYEHDEIGFGERLDALQAAILSVKLKHLDRWIAARRALAERYTAALADTDLVTPGEVAGAHHAYHLYVVRSAERDALLSHLDARGVKAGVHYPVPLHRQPAYQARGYGDVELPHTERAAQEVLSLPLYPELTSHQADHVVAAVKEFLACVR
jgi:dTDP-4-amino-4,6-dideoxygalactose transaminase